jgi:hypothetical protein
VAQAAIMRYLLVNNRRSTRRIFVDKRKKALAEKIDAWVIDIVSAGGGDEQLLEGMYDYMDAFKQLLDSCSTLEMNMLAQRYIGFARFAHLLELLAQEIADGAIEVPPDAPLPEQPRKPARQRRSRVKRRAAAQQREQIRRPIDMLPLFTEMIIGTIHNTEEQYQTFAAVRHKPHVLDDAIVDRALRLYEEQLDDVALHERQMHWWLSENLSEAQRYQVNDLLAKLSGLRTRTQELLTLLAEIKQGTIDRILEMDDAELGVFAQPLKKVQSRI